MHNKNRPLAVLFDADGVIQRSPPDWMARIERLSRDPERTGAFLADVFKAGRASLCGEGDFEESLAVVLRHWNSKASVSEALDAWKMIEPDDDVLRMIDALRSSGTIVGLATNQQKFRADYMMKTLGYEDRFDYVFCSCYLGLAKPSEEYFLAALSTLDLNAREVLFIDDDEQNVEVARSIGMKADQFHLDSGIATLESLVSKHGLRNP